MRGLRHYALLVLGTGMFAAACDRDEESGLATAPTLASAAGQCRSNTIDAAVRDAFTNNTTRQTVLGYADAMVDAFDNDEVGQATWYGFQILSAVETDAVAQGGLEAASALAVATFPCMSLGTATLPTSLTTQLGTSGAFGVRGRTATDVEAVISNDDTWIIEPPDGQSWHSITTLETRAGITGATAELFLALGKPGSNSGFVGNGDQLLASTFDWTTIPTATFSNPYVVVGHCAVGGGFLQHFPATNSNGTPNSNAEIFGFVQPAQCPEEEPEPQGLAARLFRALSPAPAYAAARLAGSGGGSKPSLSPYGIIHPGKVNLSKFTTSPSKSGNVKNKLFNPTPVVNPKSAGGVAFKQASVLAYLVPIANQGTPGNICWNWAYNDDLGVTDFPRAFYTKAGGLSLRAISIGTVSTGESTDQPVPVIEGGALAISTSFNVKNSTIPVSVCPVFDGTKYFSDILDPGVQPITFDPQNAATFPPNYDIPGS